MTDFELECLYQDIKRDGWQILQAANNGCRTAGNVIDLHRMCVKSADAPTVTLLGLAYSDWKANSEAKE